MTEVLAAARASRETQGVVLEEMPRPNIEETNSCVLASCFFDSGVHLTLGGAYLPGEQNVKEDGRTPRDMLGQEVRYRCIEEGCTMKQAMETTKELRELASEVVSSHFCQIDNSATCLVAPL